jgi:adenylate cyclase
LERKLTAILCADVHGYSRLMGEDEEATLRTLSSHRKLIDSLIEQHHGRFVNSAGDSVLAEFASVVNAVQCAVEIQTTLKSENANLPPHRRMEFRIGVNLGDVIVDGEQIYGDGVNVAARLESLAEPGGICVSASVHEQLGNKLAISYEDLGEQTVKNITKPVRVLRVMLEGGAATGTTTKAVEWSLRKHWRGGIFSMAGLAIIVATVVFVQHLSLKPPRTHASIPPQEKPALPLPSIPSVAVLPFTNLSGDAQQEYFSDGITDQLINDLSRIPGLFVIARNSSFAYKGKATREQEVGKELGVKYVLDGSVRRTADRVRVGVALVDASSGTEMWTEHYDRPLKDIFAVQDEIVGKVVTTLNLIFKLDAMKIPRRDARPTDNLEAFDDLLRAWEYRFRLTKDDNARSRQWLEKAIKLDPKCATAYALLGSIYWSNVWNQWSEHPKADLERASQLVHKALALDDSNSVALNTLSYVDWMQRRYDQAVVDAERAVAINPNDARGYVALSDALLLSGSKPEEALRAVEQAIRLDPAGQDYYAYSVGLAYVAMGRYQEAVSFLKRNLAAHPNNLVAHLFLIIAYAELGRDEEARAEAAQLMRINPQFALTSLPPNKNLALGKRWDSDLRKAGLK